MSFTIKLQMNNSPANQATKSVTDIASYTGTLKDGSSLQDPVVILEDDNVVTGFNYARIDAFGRSYFVKEVKNITRNMWEVSLHSDALSTFASQIRACQAIIAKNERSFNLYLNDANFRCYQNPHVLTRTFPNGFDYANFKYVVAICAGKESA